VKTPRRAPALDRVIHQPMRLAILSELAAVRSMTFSELLLLVGTTDGNLSVHARRLEEAGYLACEKGFEGRIPRTRYRATAAGRRALSEYRKRMRTILDPRRR
jgi:DNA-binding transcriptional ArsR family regulator